MAKGQFPWAEEESVSHHGAFQMDTSPKGQRSQLRIPTATADLQHLKKNLVGCFQVMPVPTDCPATHHPFWKPKPMLINAEQHFTWCPLYASRPQNMWHNSLSHFFWFWNVENETKEFFNNLFSKHFWCAWDIQWDWLKIYHLTGFVLEVFVSVYMYTHTHKYIYLIAEYIAWM